MVSTDRRAGVRAALAFKAPVRVATTANITLSGEQTIDGVAVVADDRVLVKDQTDGTENGLYVASTSAWTRSVDFDGVDDVATGTMVLVTAGTANAGFIFKVTTTGTITPGTTSITFASATFTDTSISAYWQTIVDETNSSDALAALSAAGSSQSNLFSQIQQFGKGTDIASTAAIAVGTDGLYFDVTGNTTITSMTVSSGALFALQFDSSLTLTHASTLSLPGGKSIETVAGDRGLFYAKAANDVECLSWIGSSDLNLFDRVLRRAKLEDYSETALSVVSSSGEMEFPLEQANNFYTTLTENVTTFTVSGKSTESWGASVSITQHSTAAKTWDWSNEAVKWAGGTAPDITTTGAIYDVTLWGINGDVHGFLAGSDVKST